MNTTTKRKLQYSLPLLFSLIFLGGCLGGGDDEAGAENLSENILDEHVQSMCEGSAETDSNCHSLTEELIVTIANHTYLTENYSKISAAAGYPSAVSLGKNIAVYINNESAEDFSLVDPDFDGTNIEVEVGTIIIREIWSEVELEKYTAMIKMEAGYFPEGGDFSYVEFSTDGSLLSGGKNEECATCHKLRDADGFLFGVDEEHKNIIGAEPTQPAPITDPNLEPDPVESRVMTLARDAIQNQRYLTSEDFVQVTTEPFASALNSESYIELYVSSSAYKEFNKVDPNSNLALQVDVPEDTVIVRTVSTFEGVLKDYTVMVKGPEGYYPNGGDYYYGVFDTQAEVQILEDDAREGPLVECGGCHKASRSTSGFLFGVANEYKNLDNLDDLPDQEPPSNDEQTSRELMILAREALHDQLYIDTNRFALVNSTPFVSALNSENYINVYVSRPAYTEFKKADPDSSQDTQINIPEGTVIIRTVSSAEGQLNSYTVMVKGPEGYYPGGGDYYYGVFDTAVQVISENNEAKEGALTECGGCHRSSRGNAGFIFGVSPSIHTPQAP